VPGPSTDTEPVAELPIDAADMSSARRARAWARDWLGGAVAPDAGHDLALVLSELVTNAVLHGSAPVLVRLTRTVVGVRVEVEDDSPALPRRRRIRPDAPGGRGLLLVASVSERWGVQRRAHGKRVWAELRLHLG